MHSTLRNPHSAIRTPMNLFLIGYRGTGKTTVARRLAGRLGREWVDADVELELRAGKSIAAIFADDGEPAFRDLESRVLTELAAREGLVIATGGGVVMREENRRALAGGGKVVWLRASPAAILERLAADQTTAARRPQLTTSGGEKEVLELLALRTPWYRACANLAIDTDDRQPGEIVQMILDWLKLDRPPRSTE